MPAATLEIRDVQVLNTQQALGDPPVGSVIQFTVTIRNTGGTGATLYVGCVMGVTPNNSVEEILARRGAGQLLDLAPQVETIDVTPPPGSSQFPFGVGGVFIGPGATRDVGFISAPLPDAIIPPGQTAVLLDLGVRAGIFENNASFTRIDDELVVPDFLEITSAAVAEIVSVTPPTLVS